MPKLKMFLSGPDWPPDYRGKYVEVEITGVRLPNGVHACCGSQGYEALLSGSDEFPKPPTAELVAAEYHQTSLVDLIGGNPSNITVNFK